jgi:hypothetical protein
VKKSAYILKGSVLAVALALCLGLAIAEAALAAGPAIAAPKEGDLLTRVRALWAQTLPLVEADAASGQDDAWFQARRTPIFGAWVGLQRVQDAESGVPPATREAIARLIPRILELVDQVYGFPGYSREKREKARASQGRTRHLIKDIQAKLAAIG